MLFVCLFFLLRPAPPTDTGSRDLVRRFEQHYRGAKTLQATFLESYSDNGKLVRTDAGIAYFRRPGKMRWEYERPEKDLFLVDGKTSWFYVPSDHTVMRVPAKESSDFRTPLALLAGEMKVSRVCEKVELSTHEQPENDGNAVISCRVRGSGADAAGHGTKSPDAASSDVVLFEVVCETGELARLIVRQPGGSEIEFRFENWRLDPPLSESMFHFSPPLGVAIVNGELAGPSTPLK